MQILPFDQRAAYFPEDKYELVNVPDVPYPMGSRKEYRRKIFPEFDFENVDQVLGQIKGATNKKVVYVLKSEGNVDLAVIPGVEEMSFGEPDSPKIMSAIKGAILTILSVSTGRVGETGYVSRGQFKNMAGINVVLSNALKFVEKLRENASSYLNNEGQLRMSEELGGTHLGLLFGLGSALGVTDELQWTCMSVPYKRVGEFKEKLEADFDVYVGNEGQLKMCQELGGMHLKSLYSLASSLKVVDKLKWTIMGVPYEKVEEFSGKLETDFKDYVGNGGQLEMSKELGGINLGSLYSLASSLAIVDDLEWTKMDVPYEIVEKFREKLEADFDGYVGNEGQLKICKELGGMHLGHLYSLASGLGMIEKLKWTQMNVKYEKVEEFRKKLETGFRDYVGNRGQLKICEELGGMNLGRLYSLVSGLGLVKKLEWTYMDVSYEMVGEFEDKLKADFKEYISNLGQLKMSEELGGMHLKSLHALASGLGLTDKLKWTKMNIPYEKVGEFMKKMETDFKGYVGNEGQLKMSKELGNIHLAHLYSLASGLDMVDDLKWTRISVPYEKVGEFREKLKTDFNYYVGNEGQLKMSQELGGMNLGELHSLASGLEMVDDLEWTKMSVPYKNVGEFREKLRANFRGYVGNEGQLKMSEELGGIQLGTLYNLASGLGLAGKLKWTWMNVQYEKVGEFRKKLETDFDGYVGNGGQLKMSEELGVGHLGSLYSLASGLGLAAKLKWTYSGGVK